MHNYFTNYHTPTCFDTIVSSSVSFQVTQVFQMQLFVVKFTINIRILQTAALEILV